MTIKTTRQCQSSSLGGVLHGKTPNQFDCRHLFKDNDAKRMNHNKQNQNLTIPRHDHHPMIPWKSLLFSNQYADVLVHCQDGVTIPAHSQILASASPIHLAQRFLQQHQRRRRRQQRQQRHGRRPSKKSLHEDDEEDHGIILWKVPYPAYVVKAILEYIYLGVTEEPHTYIKPSSSSLLRLIQHEPWTIWNIAQEWHLVSLLQELFTKHNHIFSSIAPEDQQSRLSTITKRTSTTTHSSIKQRDVSNKNDNDGTRNIVPSSSSSSRQPQQLGLGQGHNHNHHRHTPKLQQQEESRYQSIEVARSLSSSQDLSSSWWSSSASSSSSSSSSLSHSATSLSFLFRGSSCTSTPLKAKFNQDSQSQHASCFMISPFDDKNSSPRRRHDSANHRHHRHQEFAHKDQESAHKDEESAENDRDYHHPNQNNISQSSSKSHTTSDSSSSSHQNDAWLKGNDNNRLSVPTWKRDAKHQYKKTNNLVVISEEDEQEEDDEEEEETKQDEANRRGANQKGASAFGVASRVAPPSPIPLSTNNKPMRYQSDISHVSDLTNSPTDPRRHERIYRMIQTQLEQYQQRKVKIKQQNQQQTLPQQPPSPSQHPLYNNRLLERCWNPPFAMTAGPFRPDANLCHLHQNHDNNLNKNSKTSLMANSIMSFPWCVPLPSKPTAVTTKVESKSGWILSAPNKTSVTTKEDDDRHHDPDSMMVLPKLHHHDQNDGFGCDDVPTPRTHELQLQKNDNDSQIISVSWSPMDEEVQNMPSHPDTAADRDSDDEVRLVSPPLLCRELGPFSPFTTSPPLSPILTRSKERQPQHVQNGLPPHEQLPSFFHYQPQIKSGAQPAIKSTSSSPTSSINVDQIELLNIESTTRRGMGASSEIMHRQQLTQQCNDNGANPLERHHQVAMIIRGPSNNTKKGIHSNCRDRLDREASILETCAPRHDTDHGAPAIASPVFFSFNDPCDFVIVGDGEDAVAARIGFKPQRRPRSSQPATLVESAKSHSGRRLQKDNVISTKPSHRDNKNIQNCCNQSSLSTSTIRRIKPQQQQQQQQNNYQLLTPSVTGKAQLRDSTADCKTVALVTSRLEQGRHDVATASLQPQRKDVCDQCNEDYYCNDCYELDNFYDDACATRKQCEEFGMVENSMSSSKLDFNTREDNDLELALTSRMTKESPCPPSDPRKQQPSTLVKKTTGREMIHKIRRIVALYKKPHE